MKIKPNSSISALAEQVIAHVETRSQEKIAAQNVTITPTIITDTGKLIVKVAEELRLLNTSSVTYADLIEYRNTKHVQ